MIGSRQRKRGMCLTTNPVVQNHSELQRSASSELPSTSACTRPAQCQFKTFKGTGSIKRPQLQSSPYHPVNGRPLSIVEMNAAMQLAAAAAVQPKESQAVVEPTLGNSVKTDDNFQTVPLDDDDDDDDTNFTASNRTVNNKWQLQDPIKPIDLTGKPQDAPDEKHRKSRNIGKLPSPFMFAGYAGTIGSSLCFSLSVLFLRLLPVEDSLQEKTKACMFRGIFLVLFCATTIIVQGSSFKIPREELLINFIRSFVGCAGTFGSYVAILYITIGEASALMYSSPIWTCILSYFILDEKLPVTLVVAMPLGALAIILIAHPDLLIDAEGEVLEELERNHHHIVPPPEHNKIHHYLSNRTSSSQAILEGSSSAIGNQSSAWNLELPPEETIELFFEQRWPGVVVALATSLVVSIIFIVMKFRKKTPIQTCTFYLGVATVIVAVTIQCFIGFGAMPASLVEWSLLAGVGATSYLGQTLFQWSLLFENASTLSVVRTVDIAMSFAWSALFLNDEILWTSVMGALMIMLIVALLMLNVYITKALKSIWLRCCCLGSGSSGQNQQ